MVSKRPRAMTILEVLVASALLMLLMTAVFGAYQVSASTFFKGDAQTDLLQSIQVVGGRWTKDVEGSFINAITVSPTAMAVPSAWDVAGNITLDPTGNQLLWQRYRVYYYTASAQTVCIRDVVLATPTTAITPIEVYDDGSGPHPLSYWATGGRVVARQVTAFTPVANGRLFTLTMQANQKRYGSERLEEVLHTFTIASRN